VHLGSGSREYSLSVLNLATMIKWTCLILTHYKTAHAMTKQKTATIGRSILYGALAGIGLAIVFSAGFFVRDLMDMPSVFAASPSRVDEPGYPLLDEVQDLLDQHFLREQPDYTQRQYAAIRGMLGALGDRNTFFIEPPVAQSESDVLAGTYGGIGVNVQRSTTGEFLLFPFDDGPAIEAGVEDGDVLTAVNGEPLATDTHPDAVNQMLRGEVKDDNGVEITLLRGDEELTLFVLFEVINIPSVQWRVLQEDDEVGYIQILRFSSRTPDEFLVAYEELEGRGVRGLVVDLRDNFGGLLQESIDVASIFLDGGNVLYEVTQDGEREYAVSDEVDGVVELPVVVLVNQGTASASELLAGALQDRERAVLIGQNTYGKGTIQQIYQLSDSSSIHITSAEWLTPDRNRLDGVGLEPDIPMIPDENGRDVELDEAIRYLNTQFEGD